MRTLRTSAFLATAFAAMVAAAPGTASALSLDFTPATQTIAEGGTASIDVWLRDLGGTLIGAFDISLSFDPAVLGLAPGPVVFGTGLGDPSQSVRSVNGGAGSIDVAEVSLLTASELDALQSSSNDLLLLTLSFSGLKAGFSPVDAYYLLLSDAAGGMAHYDITFSPAVEVQPRQFVPEPGTFLLLGVGIFGLAGLRRKMAARRG